MWRRLFRSRPTPKTCRRPRPERPALQALEDRFLLSYTIADLGTLGGGASYAYAVNASGWVAGYAATSTGYPHAFLYHDGAMTDLGTLGGSTSGAYALNDAGEVVGDSAPGPRGVDGFLYRDGELQDLTDLTGGRMHSADGINDAGQVVDGNFLYSNGVTTSLGNIYQGCPGNANAINGAGQITGGCAFPPNASHAGLYANGQWTDLDPQSQYYSSTGLALNAAGEVVGTLQMGQASNPLPFVYNGSGITILNTSGYYGLGEANGINAAGEIVGYALTSLNGPDHALLWQGDTVTDLNNLIPAGSSWTLNRAQAINDAGQIVGYGTNPAGQTHAFLLTPMKPHGMPAVQPVADLSVSPPGSVPAPLTSSPAPAGLPAGASAEADPLAAGLAVWSTPTTADGSAAAVGPVDSCFALPTDPAADLSDFGRLLS
jgi:probable HAF family extracellular repeat protein